MIEIIGIKFYADIDGLDAGRHVDVIISDGVIHYFLSVGGIPLIGDLQFILDARKSELWQVAQAKSNQLSIRQVHRLLYNSRIGGWDGDDYQEAVFERDEGDDTKWNILKGRRAAIRAAWPL